MKKKKVIVVGAGLAGLAAGYELSQSKDIDLTILEADSKVGGRVQSIPINGQMVDFGGFIIYPWYKQYHRLMDEMDITDQMDPIQSDEILFNLENSGDYLTKDDLNVPSKELRQILFKALRRLHFSGDVAEPQLDRFNNMTIAEYIQDAVGTGENAKMLESLIDAIIQGYCYGPVDEYKAAFFAPVVRSTTFFGDLSSAFFFRGGNSIMTGALESTIRKNGGNIMLDTRVTGIKEKTITTTQGELSADAFVFAQRVDSELFKQILPNTPVECRYTHFVTATLEFEHTPKINGADTWGGVFYVPDNKSKTQILTAINLRTLYTPDLCGPIIVNVIIRDETLGELSKDELFEHIKDDIPTLFPGTECKGISEMIDWKQTMPVSQELFVQTIRDAQGKNDYYFAGDYLGSPSMEVALNTGVRAAEHILDDLPLN